MKKQYAEQIPMQDQISSPLPVRLKDGEEAFYRFPFDGGSSYLENFIKEFLHPHPRWRVNQLKVRVFTSVGKIFEAKIEKGLRNKILEYIEKRKHQ